MAGDLNIVSGSLGGNQYLNAPHGLYDRVITPAQTGASERRFSEPVPDATIRTSDTDAQEVNRLYEQYFKQSGRSPNQVTNGDTSGYSTPNLNVAPYSTLTSDWTPSSPITPAKRPPPRNDVDSVESTIKTAVDAAEHGDAEARRKISDGIYALSWQDRKQLASKLEFDYSSIGSQLIGGVSVDRDVIGNVRSITFNPSGLDRLESWMNGDHAHAVKVTSPMVENYNAQPDFYEKVKSEYYRLPLKLRQMLVDRDYVIATGHTIIDASPSLAGKKSSELNGDYNHAEGLHLSRENRILVVERAKTSDDQWTANDEPQLSLRHEIGHAVDATLGYPSTSSSFNDAYAKDSAGMTPQVRQLLHYYQQKSPDGQSETFAQLFAILSRSPAEQLSPDNALMLQVYRRTVPLVQHYVDEVSKPMAAPAP